MSDSISRPQCAYPDCDKIISRQSTYCRKHGAMIRANTPEGRARLARAAKAQIINPFKGRTHTEETRAIIRQKRALQVFSPESIKKLGDSHRGQLAWNKGGTVPDAIKEKIASTLRSKHEQLSSKAKERYTNETEEQRERRLTNWIKAGQENIPRMLKGTSIEAYVAQCLDAQEIVYEPQKRISYYTVDFYLPAYNLILDVHGCFWHGCEQCGYNELRHIEKRHSDQKRYHALIGKGYTVESIWEHSIRKAMSGECILRLPL